MLGKSFRIGSLLLLPAVAVTVLALYLGGAVPYRVYVIHTGSMSPTIPSRAPWSCATGATTSGRS